jgi:hypothetical protein
MNTRVKNKVPQRQVSEKIDVYDWTSTAKVYGDIFKAQQDLDDWSIELEADEDYGGISAGLVITGWRDSTQKELETQAMVEAHHRDLEKQRAESELERTRARFPELFK